MITNTQRSPWLLGKNIKRGKKKTVSNKNIFVRQAIAEETRTPNKEHELVFPPINRLLDKRAKDMNLPLK